MTYEDTNNILKGSNGKVWVNGKHFANVKSLEAKVKGEYSDIKACGDLATHHVYLGFDGSGDITLHKINTDLAAEILTGFKTGNIPEIKIITSLTNSKGKSERAQITEVVFEEAALMQMSEKNPLEDKFPFKFSDYDYLDRI